MCDAELALRCLEISSAAASNPALHNLERILRKLTAMGAEEESTVLTLAVPAGGQVLLR